MKLKYISTFCLIVATLCIGFVAASNNKDVDDASSVSYEQAAEVPWTEAADTEVPSEVARASVSETVNEVTGVSLETQEICGYKNLGIVKVENDYLNIRKEASTDAEIVGKMPKDAACEIHETEDEWYYITSGEITGYVKAEYIIVGDEAKAMAESLIKTVAVSLTDYLNVRTEPNTECSVIRTVSTGRELDFVENIDGWVKILLNGKEGYVSADYVEVKEVLPRALTMTEARYGVGISDVRIDLVEYACQFVGNPYVWGGTSLTNGADCSGFVLSVFKNYGYTLPHYSVAQSECGTKISEEELLPGDLIFYSNGTSINHVAIYMGGGQVVHASSPTNGIMISSYKYRTPVKYVRIIED